MKSAFILTALAIATLSAPAQDLKGGFQLTLSQPQGDLADSIDQTGAGIGGHLFIDLKHGHALVPRIDYTTYTSNANDYVGTDGSYIFVANKYKANILTLGVDYNYFFSRRANRGIYVAAGIAYSSIKFTVDADAYDYYDGYYSFSTSSHVTKSTIALNVGGGYMFNPNVGMELKYTAASYQFNGYDLSAPSLNASFLCRF